MPIASNDLVRPVIAPGPRTEADTYARMQKAEAAPTGGRLPRWTGNVFPRASKRPAARSPRTTDDVAFKLRPMPLDGKLYITLRPVPYAPGRKPMQQPPSSTLRGSGEAMPQRPVAANVDTYRPAARSAVRPTITLDFGRSTPNDTV